MSSSSLARVLAPLATFVILLLTGTTASAYGWTAEWTATTSITPKIFFAAPDQPVCRWIDGGFVGTAYRAIKPGTTNVSVWACGGKTATNEIQLLAGDKGYKLIAYSKTSDWQPAHTILDHDKGLCVANVANQKAAGTITRGDGAKCNVMIMGQSVAIDDFSYIVTRSDGISHENGWWNATSKPEIPLTAFQLPSGQYLCRASDGTADWYGTTFVGTPPNKSAGQYCKITKMTGSQATHVYVAGYNEVFLNNKPSKAGAIYLGASGSSWKTLDNGYSMCWREAFGGTIGVRKIPSACAYPGGYKSGTVTGLYKR